jgi:hypothetical protein
VLQVEAFDDPDACLEQDAMSFRASAVEPAHRKIIHAHGLNAALGQVLGCFRLDVNIFLLEVIRLPAAPGIPGLEEHALALCQVMRFQLRGSDHFGILDLNHARPPDGSCDRHGLHSSRALQVVARSVHMSSDVRGGGNLR